MIDSIVKNLLCAFVIFYKLLILCIYEFCNIFEFHTNKLLNTKLSLIWTTPHHITQTNEPKKCLEKWDVAEEYKKEYLELIDKHIAIEKKNLKEEKTITNILCPKCRKDFQRQNIYVYYRSCYRNSENQELIWRYKNSKN